MVFGEGRDREKPSRRIAAALPAFVATIEAFGDLRACLLIGFSQGAIMAMNAVADGLPVAGVFAISGRLAGPVPARTTWPPVTLLHGDTDRVMPAAIARATEGWLRDAGATPTLAVFEQLGHAIDRRTVAAIPATTSASPSRCGIVTGVIL